MLKRLIEVALPLKEVSEHSAREKSIRHGHISTLHIWWARRPLAACRAVVFASLIPDPDDHECPEEFRTLVMDVLGKRQFQPTNGDGSSIEDTPRNRCLEFIKYLVRWENTNNPNYIEPACKLIAAAHKFLHPDAEGDAPKVLDPFAGGGSIPLEALRLGCESHAIDLNPVAHLIELCTLVYPQKFGQPNSRPMPDYIKRLIAHNRAKREVKGEAELFDMEKVATATVDEIIPDVEITEEEYRKNPLVSDFRYWSAVVKEQASQSIQQVYASSGQKQPLAFLWTRTCKCPNPTCSVELPLLQTRAVAIRNQHSILLRLVSSEKQITFSLESKSNPSDTDLAGTMSRNSACCPACGTVISKVALEQVGKERGFGHQMTCIVEMSSDGKAYRNPLQDDLDRIEQAKIRLSELHSVTVSPSNVPDEPLPYLRSIFNVHVYGLDQWAKLFNQRQLVTLVTLISEIRAATLHIEKCHEADYAKAVTALLTLAVGR